MALTEDDKAMISYFWTERGDMTRWVFWEEKLPDIEKELPHLIDAMRRLESAQKTLDAIVRSL